MGTDSYHDDDEIMGKAFDARLVARLMRYLKPYLGHFFTALTLGIIMTGLMLASPFVVRDVFNTIGSTLDPEVAAAKGEPSQIVRTVSGVADVEVIPMQPGEAEPSEATLDSLLALLPWFAGLLLILEILKFGVKYLSTFLVQILGQRVLYDLRDRLFSHIIRLPVSFFQKQPVGRLVTRLSNDIEALNEMFSAALIESMVSILMVLGVAAALVYTSLTLGPIVLSVVPLIILVTVIFQHFVRKFYRAVRKLLSRINAYLAEQVSGMREVQLFNREQKNYDTFGEINEEHYGAIRKVFIAHGLYRPAVQLIYALALALVLWFGGMQHIGNRAGFQIGDLWLFITLVQHFFQPIMQLAERYNIFQAAMAAGERVFQLLDTVDDLPAPEQPRDGELAEKVCGEIRFEGVHFRYRPDDPVLQGIDFTVKPGEHVALVGHTGSGKTTCIKLLGRYYLPQEGHVTLDGVDLAELSPAFIRSNIAVVHQDVFCFRGTIGDNITLGNDAITRERMEMCARAVNAHTFIDKLPGRFEAEVTEGGKTFSLGERQLLAFARALAADPAILVLDEATASIDTPTERLIQDALATLIKGRTAIIIAHRLSTITSCDRIYVLDHGRITEEGTHEELLAMGGHYAQLYYLQFADQEEDATADPSATTTVQPRESAG